VSYIRKLALCSALLTAIGVSVANAHVEFTPDTAVANKNQLITLTVPHDCSAATKTIEVKVLIPNGLKVSTINPMGIFQHGSSLKNWKLTIMREGLRYFLDAKGPAITTGPDGGKNGAHIKFTAVPAGAHGSQLKLPTAQYCTKGVTVSWVQPRPADGSDPAESATPVPVLNLK